jgi:hypothetical protein
LRRPLSTRAKLHSLHSCARHTRKFEPILKTTRIDRSGSAFGLASRKKLARNLLTAVKREKEKMQKLLMSLFNPFEQL